MSSLPKKIVSFDPSTIKPQWWHQLLSLPREEFVLKANLESMAYDYYVKFLVFFRNQPEGSLRPGVGIDFSGKMRHKLGLADLFHHSIRLNFNYFRKDPRLLPYTLFHEMVHLWLYNCHLDPGHTRRFYAKMQHFARTGLPVDPEVYQHSRIAADAKFVYECPQCKNRWYVNEQKKSNHYCGFCFALNGERFFPVKMNNLIKSVISHHG